MKTILELLRTNIKNITTDISSNKTLLITHTEMVEFLNSVKVFSEYFVQKHVPVKNLKDNAEEFIDVVTNAEIDYIDASKVFPDTILYRGRAVFKEQSNFNMALYELGMHGFNIQKSGSYTKTSLPEGTMKLDRIYWYEVAEVMYFNRPTELALFDFNKYQFDVKKKLLNDNLQLMNDVIINSETINDLNLVTDLMAVIMKKSNLF